MRNGTLWEVQVRLADQTTALLTEGVLLRPTEFELRAELQNATAVSGQLVHSRARGGRGYVCCGAVNVTTLHCVSPSVLPSQSPTMPSNQHAKFAR